MGPGAGPRAGPGADPGGITEIATEVQPSFLPYLVHVPESVFVHLRPRERQRPLAPHLLSAIIRISFGANRLSGFNLIGPKGRFTLGAASVASR